MISNLNSMDGSIWKTRNGRTTSPRWIRNQYQRSELSRPETGIWYTLWSWLRSLPNEQERSEAYNQISHHLLATERCIHKSLILPWLNCKKKGGDSKMRMRRTQKRMKKQNRISILIIDYIKISSHFTQIFTIFLFCCFVIHSLHIERI